MYNEYFGFKESPFSIAPDPHYLYMTDQHREALAHLVYGLNSKGGCILLTGEVGTGKTTICRCLLEQIPDHANIALLLNPKVTAIELLESICDEFKISYSSQENSVKIVIDLINNFLLEAYARNEKTVLIIDEAQNLDDTVLEQLRLLTNLETNERKLLQIVMLGQPELLDILSQEKMRQLAQRITARFHLKALSKGEIKAYISHRLAIAGQNVQLFPEVTIKKIFQLSKGIPRLINVICDRALLGTYVQDKSNVDIATLNQAAKEIFGEIKNQPHYYSKQKIQRPYAFFAAISFSIIMVTVAYNLLFLDERNSQAFTTPSISEVPTANDKKNIHLTTQNNTTSASAVTNIVYKNALPTVPLDIETHETQQTLSDNDLLNQFIRHSNNTKASAFKQLLNLWGLKYSAAENGNACTYAEKNNLSCFHFSGNLHSIRNLNRPVAINIFNNTGENTHTIITKLDYEKATVRSGDETLTINTSTLDTHWLGKYTLIWKKPPFYKEQIIPGYNGAIVQWLDQQLARIYPQNASQYINDSYTDEMIKKVKTFQIKRGLNPDGIAGPKTLIHLNDELGIKTPKLHSLTMQRD